MLQKWYFSCFWLKGIFEWSWKNYLAQSQYYNIDGGLKIFEFFLKECTALWFANTNNHVWKSRIPYVTSHQWRIHQRPEKQEYETAQIRAKKVIMFISSNKSWASPTYASIIMKWSQWVDSWYFYCLEPNHALFCWIKQTVYGLS